MKTLDKTLLAMALCLFAAAPAFASHHGEPQTARQESGARAMQRHHAVEHGENKGRLSREETERQRREQQAIQRLAQRFYADGYLSDRERALLNRRLRESRLQIKAPRHDELERYVHLHQRYGHEEQIGRL